MKIVLFANTEWYLYNFRRSLAEALRHAGHDVLLISPPGQYGARLGELGFRWIPAPMYRRSLNPVREGRLILWLTDVFRRERVDLVHGFTIKSAIYGSIAAHLAKVPARVNAVAGMGYVFTSDRIHARMLRGPVRALMRAAFGGDNARLILQNPDDVQMFVGEGLIGFDRVRLIPGSGVNIQRFCARGARKVGDPLSVLLAARLLWDKGIGEYVEASRLLRSQGRHVRLLLAGEPDAGNPAAVPESTVRRWEGEGLVEWLGQVHDMAALFAKVHVVALPSYREGLPKTLIEAAACGLALITTDTPGCREVVSHELDGLLVPARDPVALAAAIARLDDNADLIERLGSAAREKALRLFDEKTVIARTIDVYRELLPQLA